MKAILSKNISNAHSRSAAPLGVHDHAIFYTRLGLRVFPLRTNKRPLPGSHGFKDATCNREQVARWFDGKKRRPFRAVPHQAIGIATGAPSRVVVIDIDRRNGGDASWAKLEATHGKSTPTWTVEAPNGFHFYYAYPDFSVRTRHGRLAGGIDIKADGGYVVAPPTVRDDGGIYRWRRGCAPWERDCSPGPSWLLDELKKLENPEPQPVVKPSSSRTSIGGGWIAFNEALTLASGDVRRIDRRNFRIRCPQHDGGDFNCNVFMRDDGTAFFKCWSRDTCDHDGILAAFTQRFNNTRLPSARIDESGGREV